ncbi:hypothetical protein Shyhy01_23390 [Streptomyces hygroscopicus subsp. hygroscopicus]|nr:hypothetical protein Shyhy01_23390 [Streptomyces hygroscopicus subsp. hygroscopicus]
MATRRGNARDPAARESGAGLPPPPVLAHAAPLAGIGRPAFAARLATTGPEATGDLAALLAPRQVAAQDAHGTLRSHAPLPTQRPGDGRGVMQTCRP